MRAPTQTLHSKLMRIVVATLLFVSGSTFAVVALLNYVGESQRLGVLEDQIRGGIKEKGRVLTEGSATALHGMVDDNAFTAVQDLVNRGVRSDPDVVYGMYAPLEGDPWAFSGPAGEGPTAWKELHFTPPTTRSDDDVAERELTVFGQQVYEFAKPVILNDAVAGHAVYGLSTRRMLVSLDEARAESWRAMGWLLVAILVLVGVNLVVAVSWIRRASVRITRPLEHLTATANDMGSGVVGARVSIESGDELEVLGKAFNGMAAAVELREADLRTALVAAQEAGRLKGEFLANISHELRTPLNAIINIPSALLKDYKEFLLIVCSSCAAEFEAPEGATLEYVPDERCPSCNGELALQTRAFFYGDANEHYQYQRQVHACARHLHKLVSDVLDFSKAEANRLDLNLGEVSIGELIAEVSETAQLLAKDKKLRLELHGQTETTLLVADRVKIAQVLMNLVGNAAKFTPAEGRLVLRGEPAGEDRARFVVEDSGIGVPQDQLEVIFESFRQVDGSHTRAYGGTGLGLAISKQLVELHGGRIWCESTLGQGSRFIFELPKVGPGGEREVARPGRGHQVKKILMIDDDPVFFGPIVKGLTPKGYEIGQIHDAAEALQAIRTQRPDLVVLDVMMPGLDGLSILRAMRADEDIAGIAVVVSSGFPSNREMAMELGGYWLRKPWVLEDLEHAIMSLQGRAGTPASAEAAAEVVEV